MKINELIKKLNKDYPEEIALDFDNTGLNIGDGENIIKDILICVDVDMEAIKLAKEYNCNLIISHHPLTFNSYKNITTDINSKRIKEVIKNNINVYSMHTNFDMNIDKGMAKLVFDKLDFKNVKNISHIEEFVYKKKKYGMGICFELPKAMHLDDIYNKSIKILELDDKKTALYKVKDNVKSICIMPGSGRSDVSYVIKKKFDLFITSDLSHNDILDLVDSNINYINLTHYGLEKVFVDYMCRYVSKFVKRKSFCKYYSNM